MKLYKIAAALLTLTLLAGCGKTQEPETTTQPTQTTAETVADTSAEQTQEPAVSGIPVETPYVTLYCPAEWENSIQWEATQRGKNYAITFRLTTVEKPVELFSLVLGPEEEERGYCLGFMDHPDGEAQIYVYSFMNEVNMQDWSEEDYVEISYQQECVNELILQFHEHPGFHAN